MNVRFSIDTLKQAGTLAKIFALNQYRVFVADGKGEDVPFSPIVHYVIVEVPDQDVVPDDATWEGLV